MERAGLKRTDLQKSVYIAWQASGSKNDSDIATKYKNKTGKEPEGPDYEKFKNKAKALNAVKNWKTNVLPSLEPGNYSL